MEATIENLTQEEKLEPLSEEEKAELSELLSALDANSHELDAHNRYGWPIVQRFGERVVPYILTSDQNSFDREWFTMEFLNTVVTEKTAPLVLKALQESKIGPFYGALAAAKGKEKTADGLSDLLLNLKIPNSSGRSDHLQILWALGSIGAAEVAPKILQFYESLLNNAEYRQSTANSEIWLSGDANAVVNALVKIGGPESQKILENLAENGDGRIKNYAQKAIDGDFQFYGHKGVHVIREPQERQIRSERTARSIDYGRYDSDDDYRDSDREIEDDYKSGKFAEIGKRLDVVKNLREELRKGKDLNEEPEEDVTKFLKKHYLELREENPSPYTPTLGIEIEIRKSSLENPPQTEEDEFELKEKYNRTHELGIPRRYDKFWEFAHRPAFYYQTLSREVQALIEMSLINKENTKHPLHLTLGGIEKKDYGASDAYLLLRALEATGWSTKGNRLLRPCLVKKSCWEMKGEGGVKDRSPIEMDLGESLGIEMRTFQLQSLSGLDRMLRSAFLLGAALKASQEQKRDEILKTGENEFTKEYLAQIWESFSVECMKIFEKYELPDPQVLWRTPSPGLAVDNNDFYGLAKLLNDAEDNRGSNGGQFVSAMRSLVIKTRAEIAKIIYSKDSARQI